MVPLKDIIKFYREKNKISKSKLAREIGVSPSYITMLENGEKKNPSLEIKIRIARTLGIPLNELSNSIKFGVRYTLNKNVDFRDIKKYREQLKLSQETLSELIDINLEDIKGLEDGTISNPRIDFAIKLNDLFKPNPPFCYEQINESLFDESIYEDSDLKNTLSKINEIKNSEKFKNKEMEMKVLAKFHEDRPFFRTFSEYKKDIFLYWKDVIKWYPVNEINEFDLNLLKDNEMTDLANFLDLAFKTKILEIKKKRAKKSAYKKNFNDSENQF